MTVATILRLDLEPAIQIAWVARIAATRQHDLVLLFPLQRPGDARVDEVDLTVEPEKDESGVIASVRAAIDAAPELVALSPPTKNDDNGESKPAPAEDDEESTATVGVRLRILYTPDLVASLTRLLLAEVRECKVTLMCAVRRQHDVSNEDLNKERRQLMRKLPCELAYFCVGNAEDAQCDRILVPVAHGPHARAALALANDMAPSESATITALRVNPDVGSDAQAVGAQILERLIRRALGRDEQRVARHIEVNNQPLGGIRSVIERDEYDLIVVGSSKAGMMGRHLYGTVGTKLMRGGVTTPVAIVRAATPLTGRFSQLAERALQRIVPQMEREHRIDLVERIQSNSQWNFDFFALMTLSTLIAALGLVQNSAAVVIGAMLVAPLMTPLLGLGLALVQGNPVFARMAMRSVALGFVVAFAVSLLVGWASLGFNEPTPQIISRGNPSMLDVGVAFAAGLAAAYAMSRPGLLAALPGVAIAAALVPPLACVGLNLAVAEFSYALGAMLLFTINVVTIVFASTLSLWAVGVRKVKRGSHWTTSGTALIVVAILALAVYVSMNPIEHGFKRELPERLPHAVRDHLHPRFTLERFQVEGGARGRELIVLVTGDTIPDDAFIDSVRELVVGFFESPIRVRVVTQISSATQ